MANNSCGYSILKAAKHIPQAWTVCSDFLPKRIVWKERKKEWPYSGEHYLRWLRPVSAVISHTDRLSIDIIWQKWHLTSIKLFLPPKPEPQSNHKKNIRCTQIKEHFYKITSHFGHQRKESLRNCHSPEEAKKAGQLSSLDDILEQKMTLGKT